MEVKNIFKGLDEAESLILNIFIDLNLDAEDGQVTERTWWLIHETRKFLVSSNIYADVLFAEWKRQGEKNE